MLWESPRGGCSVKPPQTEVRAWQFLKGTDHIWGSRSKDKVCSKENNYVDYSEATSKILASYGLEKHTQPPRAKLTPCLPTSSVVDPSFQMDPTLPHVLSAFVPRRLQVNFFFHFLLMWSFDRGQQQYTPSTNYFKCFPHSL